VVVRSGKSIKNIKSKKTSQENEQFPSSISVKNEIIGIFKLILNLFEAN